MTGPNFNVTTTATPTAGPAQAPTTPQNHASNTAVKTVTRAIPAPVMYDADTGETGPAKGWPGAAAGAPAAAAPAEEPGAAPKPAGADRLQAWRDRQAQRKDTQATERAARAAKAQESARALIEKGDILGAAKALGFSNPDEFVRQTNAAFMGMPKPPAELTAEQKRDQQMEQYRTDLEKERQERAKFEQAVTKREYIRENIAPVIADKEAFEFIHGQGAEPIMAYVYDYMNRHYQETGGPNGGEVLSAKDVLESIEQQFRETWSTELATYAKTKAGRALLAKHGLTAAEVEAAATEGAEEDRGIPTAAPAEAAAPSRDRRFADPRIDERPEAPLGSRTPLREDPEEEQPAAPVAPARRAAAPSSMPFALLPRAERQRILAEERRKG